MSRNDIKQAHISHEASHAPLSAIVGHEGKRVRRFDRGQEREFRLHELAMRSITPIVRSIQHWWLQRAERHYLICADVELQRAREAQMNVAYYQKRAALARSARI